MIEVRRRRLGAFGCGVLVAFVIGCGGTVVGEDGAGGGGSGRGGSGGGATGGRSSTSCSGVTPSTDETCYEFDIGEEDSSCKVNLPPLAPGQVYDLRGVHVLHTTAAGKQEEIPHVDSVAACTAAHGGWYAEGTTIVACPCSCESFASGSVTVAIEC